MIWGTVFSRIFGRINAWQIAELKEIGKIKFGKLIDFGHKDAIYKLNFCCLKVWQITDDSLTSPNFPTAKHSRYTVIASSPSVYLYIFNHDYCNGKIGWYVCKVPVIYGSYAIGNCNILLAIAYPV